MTIHSPPLRSNSASDSSAAPGGDSSPAGSSGRRRHRAALVLTLALLFCHRTLIGGEWNWQYPLPQGNRLWKVVFPSPNYGYAVGDAGTIMITYFHGNAWELEYE